MYARILFLLSAGFGTTLGQVSNSSTWTQPSNGTTESYVLPMTDPEPTNRQQQLAENKDGYVYGPSLLGNLSFFPTGSLGDALVQAELELFSPEEEIFKSIIELEAQEVINTLSQVCRCKPLWPFMLTCPAVQHVENVKRFQRTGSLVIFGLIREPVAFVES